MSTRINSVANDDDARVHREAVLYHQARQLAQITFGVRGVISPALSNITLDGLERQLREVFPVRGKGSERGRAAQVHLIRYADDFIITGHSEDLLRMTVKPLIESFLAERGLVLSSEKTLITHIEKDSTSLGRTFGAIRTASCLSSLLGRVLCLFSPK